MDSDRAVVFIGEGERRASTQKMYYPTVQGCKRQAKTVYHATVASCWVSYKEMIMVRKGFGGITYEDIGSVTDDKTKYCNLTTKRQNQGRLEIDEREGIVRHCIWFAGERFQSKLFAIFGEMQKQKSLRDPSAAVAVHGVEKMVFEAIWQSSQEELQIYEQLFRRIEVKLLFVNDEQRKRYTKHKKGREKAEG